MCLHIWFIRKHGFSPENFFYKEAVKLHYVIEHYNLFAPFTGHLNRISEKQTTVRRRLEDNVLIIKLKNLNDSQGWESKF